MKTLLFNSVIILIVLSSCSTGKSFMHQRYTSYGHKKQHTETQPVNTYASTRKAVKPVEEIPSVEIISVAQPAVVTPGPKPQMPIASASSGIAHKLAAAPKLLKAVNEPYLLQKNNNSKSFNKQMNRQAKHGLLFGVIDAILAIILSVIFVALIVLLVLILI